MRERLQQLIRSREWELTIVTIIIFNAIILGLETSDWVTDRAAGILRTLDQIVLGIYVIELALRVYAFRLSFFRGGWNLFDFFIVAIALLPTGGNLAVLRSLRILRLLRLVSAVPSLRRVVGGLFAALPGMGSIVLLMLLVFYVAGVMATNLYGATFPDWFGTLPKSLYSLFQIMTLESWSMGIVRPVMAAHPYAWAFFIPFILSTAFAVLNLLIGVIVAAMQKETDALAEADRQAIHDETSAVMAELRGLRTEVRELHRLLEKRQDADAS